MNRYVGSRIAPENLLQGEVYRVHASILGQVFARLLDKQHGLWEITEGRLQSHARSKSWVKGDTFTAPLGSDYYEVL